MSVKVYEIVQNRIIEQIEEAIKNNGTAPWKRPWKGGLPKNYVTKRVYRGINLLLLEPGSYITFNQIKDLQKKDPKIHLKKGSKSNIIVFWNFIEKEEDDEEKKIPFLKFYRVFHVSCVEGIEEEEIEKFEHDPLEDAEELIEAYSKEVKIQEVEGGGRAFYSLTFDEIKIPSKKQFEYLEQYYSVLFHEIVHSTGHITRLNRLSNSDQGVFGSESYSKEELVAEIGSNMILAMLGIENEIQQENSIAYLYGWLKAIKEDSKLIVHAAQQAQKASDYVFSFVETEEQEIEEVLENEA